LRDYLADLAGFTPEAVEAACGIWRRGGAKKFPLSGELLAAVTAEHGRQTVKIGAWCELSEAEYDALNLADKIRHQKILASMASFKAGPMMRKGKHLTPANLPPEWHMGKARAANHHAEARRLKEKLDEWRANQPAST